jgi:chromosome segregation ATPase
VTHRRSGAGSDGVELELAALRGRVAMVEAELVAARATRDQLAGETERLRVDNQRLQARVGELAAQIEQLRRASRRQAAPFSKGTTAPHPRRPGRKAGMAYGHHARRPVPDP